MDSIQLIHSGEEPTNTDTLTDRERDVLAQLCRGDSDKQIAHALGIAQATAHKHLEAIYRKLNVQGRVEAAMAGIARGVCPVPGRADKG